MKPCEELASLCLLQDQLAYDVRVPGLLQCSPLLTQQNCSPLQRRSSTVEDKDGPNTIEQQLEHAAECAEQMGVSLHLSVSISHGLDKLDEPDASVDSNDLATKCCNVYPPTHSLEELP